MAIYLEYGKLFGVNCARLLSSGSFGLDFSPRSTFTPFNAGVTHTGSERFV